jgi:hypothetical protein
MHRRSCAGRGADHQIGGLCHIQTTFGQACDDTDKPRISGSPTTTENQSKAVKHLPGSNICFFHANSLTSDSRRFDSLLAAFSRSPMMYPDS